MARKRGGSARSDSLTGTTLADRYRVLRRLGSGGMGTVYEAEELAAGRRVAIKVVQRAGDEQRKDLARLRLEARAVQMIDHPNVVRFLDYGQRADGRPYIVMEMLRGLTLSQFIKKGGLPIEPERAAWIVAEAARGVAAAHAKGLVHRDIKPGNVMLLDERNLDGQDRVKVLDFGLVAGPMRLSERLTMTGVVVGTPHYIAPELVEHPPRVTASCDVYALGILLYQLVVGHRPFQGESFFAVIDAHLNKPIPKPRTTDSGELIKPALRRVWNRALAKDPDARFANAAELARAIEVSILSDGGQSVTAPSAASVPSGERHLVTVLTATFVDPATGRCVEGRERDRIRPVQDVCAGLIHGVGGMATPSPVGSIRAIFGLPSASEDDAMRALETATRIFDHAQGTLGEGHIEVGLHTRFVMAARRTRGSRELRPLTDCYDVAAQVGREGRLHSGVAISGTTYRTLRRELADPLPVAARVGGEAVHIVQGPIHRSGLRSNPLLSEAPHGRGTELSVMRCWVEQSMSRHEARIALVTGEAGIGKSRLVSALAREVGQDHPGLQLLQANLVEGRDRPFALFERLLTDAVGATTGARIQKVVAWITEAVSVDGDPTARDEAMRIMRLVGLLDDLAPPEAPEVARQKAFSAFASLFRSVAASGGVVMLVDDAQFADRDSLDLIDHLSRELREFPFCTVLLARDGSPLEARYERALHVAPLADDAARTLAHQLAGDGVLTDAVVDRIISRAEGNPLFVEELVRAAAEGHADVLRDLPDSIRAVVSARIDSLDYETRAALQAAALVGRDFWNGAVTVQPLVQQLELDVPEQLETLAKAGFIAATAASRFDAESEWRFANQMTLDTAYQLSVDDVLRDGHLAVAKWLGARTATVGGDSHALMAEHYERAGEVDRAAAAWLAAGDTARDRFANGQAAQDYERALSLQKSWAAAEKARVRVELGICQLLSGSTDQARKTLDRARRNRDLSATDRCRALRHLARAAAWAGNFDLQKRLLKRAVKGAAQASLSERLMVASDFAYSLIRAGRTDIAARLLDDAIATAYGADHIGDLLLPLANLHQGMGLLHRNRGRLADAEREARASMDLFEQIGYPAGTATTLTSLSVCLRDLRRFDEAADAAARSAAFFHQWGYRLHELTALINLAWSRYEAGEHAPARHLLGRLKGEFSDVITLTESVLIDAGAALAADAMGEPDNSRGLAERCLKTGKDAELGEVRGWSLYAAGIVLGDPRLLEDSAACWRMLDRPAWLARTLEALATLTQPPLNNVIAEEARNLRARMAVPLAAG